MSGTARAYGATRCLAWWYQDPPFLIRSKTKCDLLVLDTSRLLELTSKSRYTLLSAYASARRCPVPARRCLVLTRRRAVRSAYAMSGADVADNVLPGRKPTRSHVTWAKRPFSLAAQCPIPASRGL
eukprot:1926511-Rhodomonas_salina.1